MTLDSSFSRIRNGLGAKPAPGTEANAFEARPLALIRPASTRLRTRWKSKACSSGAGASAVGRRHDHPDIELLLYAYDTDSPSTLRLRHGGRNACPEPSLSGCQRRCCSV